jgi:hypothetical protein
MRGSSDPTCRDNSFMQFRKICDQLRDTASYLAKSELLERFFKRGTGTSFEVPVFVYVNFIFLLSLPVWFELSFNLKLFLFGDR